MNKKNLILVLILLLSIYLFYTYINKDHRNVSNEKVLLESKAEQFFKSFINNKSQVNNTYLDKVIQLRGVITRIETKGFILDNKIYIILKDSSSNKLNINNQVVIKGRYVGYDDILDQLKIDQATVIN